MTDSTRQVDIEQVKAAETEIIARLDVAAEYEALGVRLAGRPRASGMVSCYAYGRDDRSPSAWINVQSGYYGDSGGETDGEGSISLWQFAVNVKRFPDWRTARQHYADKAGVTLPNGQGHRKHKKSPKRLTDRDGRTNRTESQMSISAPGTEVKLKPRTYADLLALFEAAPIWKPPAKGEIIPGYESEGRPQVMLGTDEFRIANEVIDGLAELGWKPGHDPANRIYQRQGRLVQVMRSPAVDVCGVRLPDGTLRIRPLPRSIIRERIGQAVLLVVEGPDGTEVKRPPDWLANVVLDRGQYPAGIRNLSGIVRSPTLRPDGSVLQDPGYDEETGLLYTPDGQYPRIENRTSRESARQAADELLHVVCDVPFAGPQHRSVWLASVLTIAARSAIPGCCPIFVFDANSPGSGKSLAVDAASTIAFSSVLARKTWTADDNELRKTITAVLIEGVPAVNFDNVADAFGSPSLDAVVTGMSWNDRRLGTNEMTGDLPATTVWFATGNNVVLAADTARRVLYARIEAMVENPEDRTGFTHENLLAWVRQERHRLASAAITMLRGYVAAGRPNQRLVPWGSFESWSDLVRSAIVWAGLPDPCSTRAIVREKDRSA